MATNLSRVVKTDVLFFVTNVEGPERADISLLLGALNRKVSFDSAHTQQASYEKSHVDHFIYLN